MQTPLLAYSTLAFPNERIEDVAELGRRTGYGGIELRLIDGELIPSDLSADTIARVRRAIAGLELVALDTSIRLAEEDAASQISAYLRLAHDLGAPVIRVFGGALGTEPDERAARLQHGADVLGAVAEHAHSLGIIVAVETHDDFSASADLGALLTLIEHPAIGAVWDSHHPWRMGEDPATVFKNVGARVALAQVKDARRDESEKSGWKLVLLGEGEVPVRGMLEELAAGGYRGPISVEWEKNWHREIEDASIAMPQHYELLTRWFAEIPGWAGTTQP